MARILVVDDDRDMREFLDIMLTGEGYQVTCMGEPEKALQKCKKESYDLVITDLKMPRMDGIEFLRQVKDMSPETLVILITAYASGETAVSAEGAGELFFVGKVAQIAAPAAAGGKLDAGRRHAIDDEDAVPRHAACGGKSGEESAGTGSDNEQGCIHGQFGGRAPIG